MHGQSIYTNCSVLRGLRRIPFILIPALTRAPDRSGFRFAQPLASWWEGGRRQRHRRDLEGISTAIDKRRGGRLDRSWGSGRRTDDQIFRHSDDFARRRFAFLNAVQK